jgi:AhpD family alkylhydroperoxidase
MKLDDRTTELIALGASVAADCHSCVEEHRRKAAELGAGQDQAAQAIEIGCAVRKEAANAGAAATDACCGGGFRSMMDACRAGGHR